METCTRKVLEWHNFRKGIIGGNKDSKITCAKKQQDKGIDLIPVGDFSFYDQVLDTSVTFGIIPKRFQHDGGKFR